MANFLTPTWDSLFKERNKGGERMMTPTICKACEKEIYFLKTSKGNMMHVNAESILQNDKDFMNSNLGDVLFDPKKGHISHFVDCPEAKKFRKKKDV